MDRNGNRNVAYVNANENGLNLNWNWLDNRWNQSCRFLVVRKSLLPSTSNGAGFRLQLLFPTAEHFTHFR